MQRKRFEKDACGIARALDAVGEWWTLLIVREAMFGARQFEEFQRRLGISRNALTARLKRLVALGVLEQAPLAEGGRRMGYRLTAAGKDLSAVMIALRLWGDAHMRPEASPSRLVDREDGAPIAGLQAVTTAGRVVPRRRVVLRAKEAQAAAARNEGKEEPLLE